MKILDTKTLFSQRWLKIFSRSYEHNGKIGEWQFVSRNDEPAIHENHKPNAVIIVAEIDGKYVLTSEFRIAIGAREMAFPAGLIDAGESANDAAIREFKEETGMDFVPEYESPPNIYSSAGMTDESCQIVFGRAIGTPTTEYNEDHEDIQVMVLNKDEIRKLLEDKNVAWGAKAWCLLFGLM